MKKPTVVVGMSGGVDSSVSAYLLKEQGYDVIGLYMKNWEEKDSNGICTSVTDYEDVIRVCNQLSIPYFTVNFAKEYWDNVFSDTLRDFEAGLTPNPDVLCNREIKFKLLLERALSLGADFLATGHYCQKRQEASHCQLLKGNDLSKDQSYFLYAISESALKKALFPIGHMPKAEVRRIAKSLGLSTAEKKDSTGICFIGERNFKEFLSQFIKTTPGPFEDLQGNVIGQHDGISFYTPGQRKGLGIGGPGEAWFVAKKDIARNSVTLVQGANHPALFCDDLVANELNWIGQEPQEFPFRCKAKTRYRQPDQDCVITKIDKGHAYVHFDVPQRAITKRQSVVFYADEVCLGGGQILELGPSYYDR